MLDNGTLDGKRVNALFGGRSDVWYSLRSGRCSSDKKREKNGGEDEGARDPTTKCGLFANGSQDPSANKKDICLCYGMVCFFFIDIFPWVLNGGWSLVRTVCG